MKDTSQSNDLAAAGGRSSFPASDGETKAKCAQCGADIVDSQWFCRLPGGNQPILLCCSACALGYFDKAHAETNGSAQGEDDYECRFHFLINGEQPLS